jgi:hypothetical protein
MTKIKKSSPAKPAKKPRGDMKPTEIKPLVIAARKAFDLQINLGNLDAGETFDSWRRAQVMAAVSKPGLTACHHDDFRPLLAHFQCLAGDDAGAFSNLLKSGKPTDHAAPGDTHEARRQRVHTIAELLASHRGPITVGYVVYLVRQKTRRPDLNLGTDWQAGLADRCTRWQLDQILFALQNRINAQEGKGESATRNKSQRSKPKAPANPDQGESRW